MKKNTFIILLGILFASTLWMGCKKKEIELLINNVTPITGKAGDQVTILGTGFGATAAENTVSFGSTAATIQIANSTTIIVTVPSGISGNQIITVTTGGQSASYINPFNVVVPTSTLAITNVSTNSGKAGDVITLTGTAFGATIADNQVKFGNTSATISFANATTIVTQVPDGITGNQTISVTTGGKTATYGTPFNVTTVLGKGTSNILSGPITTNITLKADSFYLVSNFVYIRSGVTVTIEPGTIIKGDKLSKGTLIFEPGSKIMAQGTADKPIIFTSALAPGLRNLGDWGGLVLCGKARHNAATGVTDASKLPVVEGGPTTQVSAVEGQTNDADNSGVLSYVRIEYAGVALSPNNEINGLSLYAVGNGTKIDHVQVSYANDDSYEWFGGTVNAKYLIAYRGIDDDFDTDNGFSGKVQFGFSARDLTIADQSGSKGFESDNDANNSTNLPQTQVVFSNMTLVGPSAVTAAGGVQKTTANPNGAAFSANYVAAVHVRRNSSLSLFNSVTLGWPAGILFDASTTAKNIANGTAVFQNNLIGGNTIGTVNGTSNQIRDLLYLASPGAGSLTAINTIAADTSAWGPAVGPFTYWAANNLPRLKGTDDFMLTDPFKFPTPDITPKAGSPALTASLFTHDKLKDAFFDKTPAFIGAVSSGSNFTTESWVNFDPQNVVYK